jgi:hypothetical protein
MKLVYSGFAQAGFLLQHPKACASSQAWIRWSCILSLGQIAGPQSQLPVAFLMIGISSMCFIRLSGTNWSRDSRFGSGSSSRLYLRSLWSGELVSGIPMPGVVTQSPGLVTSRAMQRVVSVRSNVSMAERMCMLAGVLAALAGWV